MQSPQIFYPTNSTNHINPINHNKVPKQNETTILLTNMTTNNGLLTSNNPNYAFTYGPMNPRNVNNNGYIHPPNHTNPSNLIPPLYLEHPFAMNPLPVPHPPSATTTYSVAPSHSQLPPLKPNLCVPPSIPKSALYASNTQQHCNPFVGNMMRNHSTTVAVFPQEINCNDNNLTASISNSISNVLGNKRLALQDSKNNIKLETIKHECKHCDKQFKHKSNLKIHQIVHTKSALKCNYCDKKFARKGNLKQHLRVHTDERPYSCGVCRKAFKQPHSLKDHLRIHTGEKPFICEYCGKSFNVKHNMVIHRRLHTGERPFNCSICAKQFASKSSLNGHTKKVHPEYWNIQHAK